MQKARRHPVGLRPLVGRRFQVLFHSHTLGSFHLSLTVLVRYRSSGSIQPWRMVPPDSRRIPRVLRYSGYGLRGSACRVRGFHPLRPRFPARSATLSPFNARPTTPPAPGRLRFGLIPVRSPLLGESQLFSPPGGT